jgi:CO/xanthine dehydrogenase FAD-binding subunit
MSTRLKEFYRPADQFEALALLQRSDVHTLSFIPGPRPEPLDRINAEAVVDLSQLNLSYIKVADTGLALGALTPLQNLVESAPLQALAGGIVPEAARLTAHFGLRHWATLEGTLAAFDHLPEVALALLALGAHAVLRHGDGALRSVPLWDLVSQPMPPATLLVEVRCGLKPGAKLGGALERVARTPLDTAIVAAAAVMELAEGRCVSARLALAPSGVVPERLMAPVRRLEGQVPTQESLQAVAAEVAAAVNPPGDFRGSAGYRRAAAKVLAYRALAAAWKGLQTP